MRRRTILSLAASCLLAACAHQDVARALDMAWILTETPEEGAKLAFGQPQSDNLILMMTCQPGAGAVLLARMIPTGADPSIALASDGREARFPAEATPFGPAGAYLEAPARLSDPMLAAFQRTGDLTLRDRAGDIALAADRAARGRIKAFFTACRAA